MIDQMTSYGNEDKLYQNNLCVVRERSPALWQKTGHIRLLLMGLTAGCKAGVIVMDSSRVKCFPHTHP